MTVQTIIGEFERSERAGATESEIASFEEKNHVRLPESLKAILAFKNGGNLIQPLYGEWPCEDYQGGFGSFGVFVIYGVDNDSGPAIRSLDSYYSETGNPVFGVPQSLFVVADDLFGNAITVDLDQNSGGSVGYIDIETFGDNFSDPETHWVIAGNFDDFINMLSPLDPEEPVMDPGTWVSRLFSKLFSWPK